MEIVTDINRWLLNPEHKPLALTEFRSLSWHRVFEPCLLTLVRSRRIFSSFDARLHLPRYCVKRFCECRNGRVLVALLVNKFRCREGSVGMLSERTPYTGTDRNRKKSLLDNCLDIGERICRIASLEESLSVVRKQSVQLALASPFNDSLKVYWLNVVNELKSIPIIFSHKLLNLLVLCQFSIKLTGQ